MFRATTLVALTVAAVSSVDALVTRQVQYKQLQIEAPGTQYDNNFVVLSSTSNPTSRVALVTSSSGESAFTYDPSAHTLNYHPQVTAPQPSNGRHHGHTQVDSTDASTPIAAGYSTSQDSSYSSLYFVPDTASEIMADAEVDHGFSLYPDLTVTNEMRPAWYVCMVQNPQSENSRTLVPVLSGARPGPMGDDNCTPIQGVKMV